MNEHTTSTNSNENTDSAGEVAEVPPLAESDSDVARATKYANVVLGRRFKEGDRVRVVRLERVEPEFFEQAEEYHGHHARDDPIYGEFKRNPDVIALPAEADVEVALPDGFHAHPSGWSQ